MSFPWRSLPGSRCGRDRAPWPRQVCKAVPDIEGSVRGGALAVEGAWSQPLIPAVL